MFIKKPTAPRSFKHALYVGTRKAVISCALLGASVFISTHLITPSASMVAPEGKAPSATAPHVPEGTRVLNKAIEEGHCWTGGEGHPYPTAVMMVNKHGDYYTMGQKKVDWLLSDFSRIDSHVIAFCDKVEL